MSERTLSLLRRDTVIVAVALAAIAALSWIYILNLAAAIDMGSAPSALPAGSMAGMPGMEPSHTGFPRIVAPAFTTWSLTDFVFMLTMWSVMMIGMMTPSASPMILLYARVGRHARSEHKIFAASAWFASGYFLSWFGFALGATAAQWLLERAALLTPMMASSSGLFGGLILMLAGLYQWTPYKDSCLSQCQSPLGFIQRHGGFRRDRLGAVQIGLKHGAYCIGCCWALMALLFVGGVMNVLWIAGITVLVLAEKVLPAGRIVSRVAGAVLVAAGAGTLLQNHNFL